MFGSCATKQKRVFNSTERLAAFGKVWGFLKYYHPEVAEGELEWDSVLMVMIPGIEKEQSKEMFNNQIDSLIRSLRTVEYCADCDTVFPDSALINYDFRWMTDGFMFTDTLMARLEFIRKNKIPFENYYIQATEEPGNPIFDNEKAHIKNLLPDKEMRLLTLFRYWNIIHYFYPYKYLLDKDWNNILPEFIPEFQKTNDTLEYHLTICRLVTNISDNHGWTNSSPIVDYFGYVYHIPALIEMVEETPVVVEIFDSLSLHDGLKTGDIILKINDRDVKELIEEYLPYISNGNQDGLYRNVVMLLGYFLTAADVRFVVERDGETLNIRSKVFDLDTYYDASDKQTLSRPKYKFINDEIGYVDLEILFPPDVDTIMELMMDKHAIIFDIRKSAKGTMYDISKYLNRKRVDFVHWWSPNLDYPGVVSWHIEDTGQDSHNIDYYKGEVILLVNSHTQSHLEFTTMVLQTAPNVTTIGSQTAGTDGDVSWLGIPGAYTCITGVGLRYPDGTECQRAGVKIDIEVKQTLDGFLAGRDEVLERAVSYVTLN
jgi:hypothetical protein